MSFEPKFGQAADEFQRYRPDYPPVLFDRIFQAVPPGCRNCAMDLGAGTGKVTRELVARFKEVIAVEPDPLMAAKIREQFPGIIIRISTAEECAQEPGSADLVTIANALHWMDDTIVLKNVVSWLRVDGILAVVDPPFPDLPARIRIIFRGEFTDRWNTFRDPRLGKAGNRKERRWQNLLGLASGLQLIEDVIIANIVPMSASELTGFCRSTSYGSAYARSLADPESYWCELESRFRAAWPDGMIPVDFSPTLILARKS